MKRLSLHRLGEASERVVRRFPLVLVAAVLAAIFGILLAEAPGEERYLRQLMTAQLGIPLFLAVALASGRRTHRPWPPAVTPLVYAAAVGVLLLFYLTRSPKLTEADLVLFVQLNVAFHLLVAVLPFAAPGETRGMWQFNVTLLLRFITAAFFSVVLQAGLSLAIVAVDTLLGVDLDEEIYLQLWCVIAFVFNTAYVPPEYLWILLPFPILLFISHELYKYQIRRSRKQREVG